VSHCNHSVANTVGVVPWLSPWTQDVRRVGQELSSRRTSCRDRAS
jgi:hypothetical protein